MVAEIEKLYLEYSKFVFNIAYRMLSNRSDAEDITQEVFVKLQNKLGSFKGKSNIKTFIYRITVNQSIDLIRKQHSLAKKTKDSFLPHSALAYADGMLLDQLLKILNEKQRAIVLLYEIAGCPQKEIAETMKMSRGTVKSILSRSITKMAAYFKKEG
jgi:RNA polymerase sigma-70 factor (ECF subfamily)